MYDVGNKVKVNNSNDNYDEFRNKVLIITHSEIGGNGYDDSMYPQKLMSFMTEQGEPIPYSLYEYEVTLI
jgi:hypothetical protein